MPKINKRKRLGAYLAHSRGDGQMVAYERSQGLPRENYARLAGHYHGLLDDLIALIGISKLRRLQAAVDDIEEKLDAL